jgi:type I restriction enzyme S subunit
MSEIFFCQEKLISLCTRLTDGSHFSPKPQRIGRSIVNVKDFRNGYVDLYSCTKIKPNEFQILEASGCTCSPGDILFSKDGTVGKVIVYLQQEKIAVLSSICIIHPKHFLDQKFLGHVLLSPALSQQIANLMSGSAIRRLVLRDISELKIPLPQRNEQLAIAAILDSVDEAIRQTEAVIAKLRQVKAGMLHDLLTCGLDENGELRDPSRHPEQFKDSPLGRIPKEWEVISLSSITDFMTSGSRGWAQFYASDGPLFLRIGNLTREHINLRLDDIVHVQPPQGTEGARTKVTTGDLLISITADLGIIGCVSEKIGVAFVNQHIALVRLNKEVNPRWVAYYLASPSYQHRFGLLNDAGAKAGMNLTSVGNLQLSIPAHVPEQVRIVQCLDEVDGQVETEKRNLGKLILLKHGLMHDLLTGTVRVPANLLEATP